MWAKMLRTVPCSSGLYIIGQVHDLPKRVLREFPKKSFFRCGPAWKENAAALQKVGEQAKKAIEQSPKDKQFTPEKTGGEYKTK